MPLLSLFPLKFKLGSRQLQSVILMGRTIFRLRCRGSLQVLAPFISVRYLMLEVLVWGNNYQYKYVKKKIRSLFIVFLPLFNCSMNVQV